MQSSELQAVLFDLDGVISRTAELHASAWKQTFDRFLAERDAEPFDDTADYLAYVDGKPRHDGVRAFLASRGIVLPEGTPDDAPGAPTVHGLGREKDEAFNATLDRVGVRLYPSSLALVEGLRMRRVRTAVVTSSRNGRAILHRAGIASLFDAILDGADIAERGLRGKPAPDSFLRCARLLDVAPMHAAVVEDAVSGVAAARRGGFGLVVAVDRGGHHDALLDAGADVVVPDLELIEPEALEARLRARREDDAWRVEQAGFDPAREHAMESLFTVANGYVGVRGSPDILLPGSQGDLFVAGVYDRKQPTRPYSEEEFLNIGGGDSQHAELVSAPFPFRIALTVDGDRIDPSDARTRRYRRELDLRDAVLHTEAVFELAGDRHVTIACRRFASAAEPHLLAQRVFVTLGGRAADVRVEFSLHDPDLASNHPHLTPLDADHADGIHAYRYRTQASGYEIAVASRDDGVWEGRLGDGERVVLERIVAVYSSRDDDEPAHAARARAAAAGDFAAELARHRARWQARWRRADITIAGSYATEQALRFNAYHLLSTAGEKPYASIGARALSGRAYEGHVFWDVEIFMLPFYLHTEPALARNALAYRHHTLDGARLRARESGHAGASFAWESTVSGDDVTPDKIRLKTTGREIPIFTGTQQIHVTADVAYGVWRYWQATRDDVFLADYGVEILADTARFWTSRCERGDGKLHIRGVVGPDEYHHGVDDNAYTNWLAHFNLERAVWAVDWLERERPGAWHALCERLGWQRDEPDAWRATANDLYLPGPDKRGVIEQFAGFFDLDDYPLAAEERLQAPVHRLFDWNRINRLKLIKQADTLMLPFLFPERFTDAEVAANYRYYEPLTDHGSSLSPGIHAAVAARLGWLDEAWRYWRQSLWLDLANAMTNSALGVHPACMGGTWQALVYGFLGVRLDDGGPAWPADAWQSLPRTWDSIALDLGWRGASHRVEVHR